MKRVDDMRKKAFKMVQYALNPAKALHSEEKQKWYLFLFLPAFTWMMFFLQVYIDGDIKSFVKFVLMVFGGLVLGYIFNLLAGFLTTIILNMIKRKIKMDNVVSCIALSHTYMFFSVALGFIYRIFSISSAVVFGVAGLMCTLLPIYSGIRSLDDSPFVSPLLTTFIGVLLLGCWKILISI